MKETNLIIENLKAILEECTASEDAVSYVNGEDAGTLKAAIEALEKQEQTNTQSVNSMHTSRPNALESLNILEQAKDENGCVPMSLVRLAFRNVLEQDRWIPVTERLPEEDTEVLISYRYKEGEVDTDHVNIDITSYGTTCFGGREIHTLKEWRQPFDYFHANYEVIAWMSLPTPYREE